jgi:signal transduction histidine kinase/ligand-binding sensor domain-containing protein
VLATDLVAVRKVTLYKACESFQPQRDPARLEREEHAAYKSADTPFTIESEGNRLGLLNRSDIQVRPRGLNMLKQTSPNVTPTHAVEDRTRRRGRARYSCVATRWLVLIVCLPFMRPAVCQSPSVEITPRLTQYLHTSWTVQDGDISSEPTAIAQTKDGYLWIGTEAGLLRFDGVRFSQSMAAVQDGSHEFEVTALYGSRDGSLWVGGRHDLAQLNGKSYRSYGYKGFITQFTGDSSGRVWFSRTRNPDSEGALCSVSDSRVRCFGKEDGLECRFGNTLLPDGAGGFWVGWNQLCHWNGKSSALVPVAKSKNDSGTLVGSLVLHRNGEVLVGIDGAPAGSSPTTTIVAQGNQIRTLAFPGHLDKGVDVISMLTAQDGSLWIGTRQSGIYHVTSSRTDHFSRANGLSSDHINGLFQDVEGDIWVATTNGIDRFRLPKVITISSEEGLDEDNVSSLAPGSHGAMWIPTVNGLNLYSDDHVEHLPVRAAGGGRQVLSVLQDSAGQVWVCTTTHLLLLARGHWTIIKKKDGTPLTSPYRVIETKDGAIWIQLIWNQMGTNLYRIEGRVAVPVELEPGFQIRQLESDSNGTLWMRPFESGTVYRFNAGNVTKVVDAPASIEFGYFMPGANGDLWVLTPRGLAHWAGDKWKTLDSKSGLACSSLLQFQFDQSGNLWLLSRCGLQKIAHDEVQKWIADRLNVVHPYLIGPADGARVMTSNYLPHSALAADGKIWFGGDAGAQVLDPNSIPTDPVPPPVHVEEFIADGVNHSSGDRLQPLVHNLQIDYTALSLVNPQEVKFRYRLVGSDKQWQDAGSRRQAFYQDLKPGRYSFEVVACNNDGVWNNKGDSIAFIVPPAFYQTNWFMWLVFAVGAVIVWGLVRLREIRAAESVEARMRERLMERDRIARELHDSLLQGFQSVIFRIHTVWKSTVHDPPTSSSIETTLAHADTVLREGRDKVRELRTVSPKQCLLDELREFVTWQFVSFEGKYTVEMVGERRRLSLVVREEVLAIAKEALINASIHSHASRIECELNFAKSFFAITCRDNGIGFAKETQSQAPPNHFGLVGMKERAERIGGKLRIDSAVDAGTFVRVEISGRLAYRRKDRTVERRGVLQRLWLQLKPRNE